eukprot:760482-Hanusia_phi.AAC.4
MLPDVAPLADVDAHELLGDPPPLHPLHSLLAAPVTQRRPRARARQQLGSDLPSPCAVACHERHASSGDDLELVLAVRPQLLPSREGVDEEKAAGMDRVAGVEADEDAGGRAGDERVGVQGEGGVRQKRVGKIAAGDDDAA